jgi:hypothetical protein
VVNFGKTDDSKMDLRLFFIFKKRTDWAKCRWEPTDTSLPEFWRISNVSGQQLCYTPEAVNYVAAAFFVGIVITQMANNIISKTKTLSIAQ